MNAEDFKFWIRGMLKSWTVWAGVLVFALPDLWPLLRPELEALFGPIPTERLAHIIGIVMILIRIKTTMPIPERGGKDAPPQA